MHWVRSLFTRNVNETQSVLKEKHLSLKLKPRHVFKSNKDNRCTHVGTNMGSGWHHYFCYLSSMDKCQVLLKLSMEWKLNPRDLSGLGNIGFYLRFQLVSSHY